MVFKSHSGCFSLSNKRIPLQNLISDGISSHNFGISSLFIILLSGVKYGIYNNLFNAVIVEVNNIVCIF